MDNSLYNQLKEAGVPLDHHESDLYAKVTPESEKIVKASGHSHSTFISNIDNEKWFDIPFAFTPFWGNKPKLTK